MTFKKHGVSTISNAGKLQLYSIFHLNLAYSSIEEEQRAEVIEKCYWPLLRLARDHAIPIGIEATGYTLETIHSLDPAWIDELSYLTDEGPCEFIGSGYAQIIGPLVPADINSANLSLGMQVYEYFLSLKPKIVFVNEQAYSAGMIQHYLDIGCEAIVMEWDNPARYHTEWDPCWRYLPQYASGQYDEKIPILWNKSIAFQKFQRYAHGEMEIEEYFEYLTSHLSDSPGVMSLYGNDVEVFDFRPGRYHTEAALGKESEWDRIERIFRTIEEDDRFQIIPPSSILEMLALADSGNRLSLESPEQPIPVKKQGKYNATRWAVTGRDDLGINTQCWRIYENLKNDPDASEDDWKNLCYLYSSDFRTHITDNRWKKYLQKAECGPDDRPRTDHFVESFHQDKEFPIASITPAFPEGASRIGDYIQIDLPSIKVRLNVRRGLAVESISFKEFGSEWLIGTLRHGYFDDIAWGADFYSGHLVMEFSGSPKITDLAALTPVVERMGNNFMISGSVNTPLGTIEKVITVDPINCSVTFKFWLNWESLPAGSLRLGHITLNPEAFDVNTLFFATHNGGRKQEVFKLFQKTVNHGQAVSFLVSSSGGIGLTEGSVILGDEKKCVLIEVDRNFSVPIGIITFDHVAGSYFCRLGFSLREMDDTTRAFADMHGTNPLGFKMTVSANSTDGII